MILGTQSSLIFFFLTYTITFDSIMDPNSFAISEKIMIAILYISNSLATNETIDKDKPILDGE